MSITESNKYLIDYRMTCFDASQMSNQNEVELLRQRALVEQGFLEHMQEYPDRYKLSDKGSKELLSIFSDYQSILKGILRNNREKHRRNQRKVKVSQIIQELKLSELDSDLAESWVEYFIMRLTREGFFAWWQPRYSDDFSEIWYYYNEVDEADFLEERLSKK